MRIRLILCLIMAGLVLVGGVAACGKSDDDSTSSRAEQDDEQYEGRSSRRSEHTEEAAPPPTGPIMINEVTADELAAFKVGGLGTATAEGIIAYRDENGPFTSLADLDKAPRVGPALLEKLKDRVDFGDAAAAAAAPTAEAGEAAAAPVSGSAPVATPAVSGNMINVNTATADQLVAAKIPRLGPALAQKIVDYRTQNGPFKSLADLDQVSGVGPAMLEQLKDRVTF